MSVFMCYGSHLELDNKPKDNHQCCAVSYKSYDDNMVLIYVRESLRRLDFDVVTEVTSKEIAPQLKWRAELYDYCKEVNIEYKQPNWHIICNMDE